jgi:hypothetical protein
MIKLPFEDSIKGHLDYIKQTIEGISKGYQILLEGKIPLADIKITQEGIKVDRISM